MLTEQRYELILRLLEDKKSITVAEVRDLLRTSESTVRRDITALDKAGKLTKVFGGAVAKNYQTFTPAEPTVAQKQDVNLEEKRRVAKYAASLIEPGDFVYLDAGSSVDIMIDYLTQADAVYVTNSIGHAQKLLQKGFRVILIGGDLKAITEAIVGADAISGLRKYNFTKGFFGTNGVHPDAGYTTPDIAEAMVKEKAMEQCRECFVLADATKINQISSVTFSAFEDAKLLTIGIADEKYKKYKNVMEVEA